MLFERNPCPLYAPYFGLDIENIRKWFEYQFTNELNWENFGKKWQFDHIIPVTYFDHSTMKKNFNFAGILQILEWSLFNLIKIGETGWMYWGPDPILMNYT